ncbi:MAG TPA: type II toxin-antitoxin system prevent-host-death family antitoxin [Chloroflexia bacterium]|jgi:prevent-host-death family protein
MKRMGIRELKAHMSDALREVGEGQTIEVTNHGEVVALLVPARRSVDKEKVREALASLDALAAEIDKHVPGPVNVAEIISEMRR